VTAATYVFADILRQVIPLSPPPSLQLTVNLSQISQAHSTQGMDLAARYLSAQEEVHRELLRICAMKSETRKSSNSRRIEEELEIDPDTDTVPSPPPAG
jgi:hypothetical protein